MTVGGIEEAIYGYGYLYDSSGNLIREYPAPNENLWEEHRLYQMGVAVNSSGERYVATEGGDGVVAFDSNGNRLPQWWTFGVGDGQMNQPVGIALAGNGDVYETDIGHAYISMIYDNRVQVFDGAGAFLRSWPGVGTGMPDPTGVAVDPSGNSFVVYSQFTRTSTSDEPKVQVFDVGGNFMRSWGSLGTGNGQFDAPRGIAVAANGSVFVSDAGNARIQVFDSAGNFLRKWGSAGNGNGQFYHPSGVAIDGNGNVYVADTGNYRIQVFDSTGNFLRKWGSQGPGNGQFGFVTGIAVDSGGHVYTLDALNSVVQVFDSSGTFLLQWGGDGDDDGLFNFAEFWDPDDFVSTPPFGLAVDSARTKVYVTDLYNNRIQQFQGYGTGALPAPWATRDIGSVGVAGKASFANATFTLQGSGANIWGTADAFRFVYQPLTGDGQIVARVASVQNTNGYAKGGVMIRETLTAGSTHAMVDLMPTYGAEFSRRLSTGGSTTVTATAGIAAPYWVKLVRKGSTFSGYISKDGISWTFLGSSTINMANTVYIGLIDNSHNNTVLCTATLDSVSVAGQVAPPAVTITAPVKGASYVESDKVTITASAAPSAGATIRQVEFYAGPTFIGAVSSAPYTLTWTVPAGSFAITARVTDSSGATATSNPVAITVKSTALPPDWYSEDVGSVGVMGSATFLNNVFTLKGSGANIYGTADAFHFAHTLLHGDFQIVARVTSVQNTNSWAKAGVMIRQFLTTNSMYAMVDITPVNGAEFSVRATAGGSATTTAKSGISTPYWVKLVRRGTTFTGSVSSDGVNWVQLGSATINMSTYVQVGLIVNSHNNAVLCTGTFDHVATSGIDTIAPTVTAFTIPAASSTLTVPITALTATDDTAVTGYLVNENPSKPSASDSGWRATAPTSYTFATIGTKTLYAWAKDAAGNVSNSRSGSITVSSAGLPSPWLTQDIGSVGVIGSASYANGLFTLKGSGADIWGTADAFRFVYKVMTGDGQIIARVASLQNTNVYAKGGVMMRQSLSANSMHAMMDLKPTGGAEFSRRTSTGGTTSATTRSGVAAPYWVRLVRNGNTFTGSVSSDGVTWSQVGSTTISMTSSIYVGLIVNSHNNSALCTTTIDSVK